MRKRSFRSWLPVPVAKRVLHTRLLLRDYGLILSNLLPVGRNYSQGNVSVLILYTCHIWDIYLSVDGSAFYRGRGRMTSLRQLPPYNPNMHKVALFTPEYLFLIYLKL